MVGRVNSQEKGSPDSRRAQHSPHRCRRWRLHKRTACARAQHTARTFALRPELDAAANCCGVGAATVLSNSNRIESPPRVWRPPNLRRTVLRAHLLLGCEPFARPPLSYRTVRFVATNPRVESTETRAAAVSQPPLPPPRLNAHSNVLACSAASFIRVQTYTTRARRRSAVHRCDFGCVSCVIVYVIGVSLPVVN